MKHMKSHNLKDFYKNLIAIGKEKQKIKVSMRKGSEKNFSKLASNSTTGNTYVLVMI